MYGLVNKAIEDLARSLGGEAAWLEISRRAGVDVVSFVSLDNYPDDVTYRLVGAASEVLGVPAEQVLEGFGEHWVRYTGREGYGALMSSYGSDVAGFLRNLDALHARVTLMMPDLQPPSFEVEELGENHYRLHYLSARPGLAPMVTGLLRGIGAQFDQPVTVTRTQRREDGADHDVFDVLVGASVPATASA